MVHRLLVFFAFSVVVCLAQVSGDPVLQQSASIDTRGQANGAVTAATFRNVEPHASGSTNEAVNLDFYLFDDPVARISVVKLDDYDPGTAEDDSAITFWVDRNGNLIEAGRFTSVGTNGAISTMDSMLFTGATGSIALPTVDGSDTGALFLNSAATTSVNRGASFQVFGNEYPSSSSSGALLFSAGNSTTTGTSGRISFSTGADVERIRISQDGTTTFFVPITLSGSAGAAPTTEGTLNFDTTSHTLKYGENGTTRTVANLDGSQELTNKTFDEANNSITLSHFIEYAAAGCQAGTGFSGLTWDATDAPASVNCIDGTNVDSGSVTFADGATDRVHGSFWLPTDWTGAIDISGIWRSATASTNTVRFNIETRCVADAEVIEGSWNTAQNIDDAGKGTTLQINTFSLTSITTTGCAADEMFFWRFSRLGGDGSDTFAGDANLLKLRFKIRRNH